MFLGDRYPASHRQGGEWRNYGRSVQFSALLSIDNWLDYTARPDRHSVPAFGKSLWRPSWLAETDVVKSVWIHCSLHDDCVVYRF